MQGYQTLKDYFETWGIDDPEEDKIMAVHLLYKAREENRSVEVKWNGDHYMIFYPDGSITRIEHEGQEHEFEKYTEVITIGVTDSGEII